MSAIYLHPGKRLGSRYQLEALLGTGQFGQVWRATFLDNPSKGPVAVKVPLDSTRGQEVLMADGQYVKDIDEHPGIVRVHWQGHVGDLWVVEMDLVNGPPLSVFMEDEVRWARVTFQDIIRWFRDVADALEHLHNNKIAHGDIKPDNLLLDEDRWTLRITDFGTSRRLTDNLIRTPRHAGAWAYQAPEVQQANQRGSVSDLFSVGAVMYRAITGRLPRPTIQDLLTSAPITRPRQFNPAIPAELDELVMELLVDDPQHRLPTARVLEDRLNALMSSQPSETVPALQKLPSGMGYLDRAIQLLAEGKKEKARESAAEASLHSTGLLPALELYARLSDELGYMADAINAYKRLLLLDGLTREPRRTIETSLAELLMRLHRFEEAERYVEASLQNAPVPRATRFRAAIVLGACTKLEQSLGLLNSLLEENPRDGAAMEKKAWVLWLIHDYEESASIARSVLEIMPESEVCLRRLVEYEALAGNPRRADYYRERLSRLCEALPES